MRLQLADGAIGLHAVGRTRAEQYLPCLGIAPGVVLADRCCQTQVRRVEDRSSHFIEQTWTAAHRLGELQTSDIQIPLCLVFQFIFVSGACGLDSHIAGHNLTIFPLILARLRLHAPALHQVQGCPAYQGLLAEVDIDEDSIRQACPFVRDNVVLVAGILVESGVLTLLCRDSIQQCLGIVCGRFPLRRTNAASNQINHFHRLCAQDADALQQGVGLVYHVFLALYTTLQDVVLKTDIQLLFELFFGRSQHRYRTNLLDTV